jgi:hypothetical protein
MVTVYVDILITPSSRKQYIEREREREREDREGTKIVYYRLKIMTSYVTN